MTASHGLWLVAGREIRETTRRKTFWIVLAVLALGSTAAMVIPALVADDTNDVRIGIHRVDPELAQALVGTLDQLDTEAKLLRARSLREARQAVRDDRVDLAVVGGSRPKVIAESDTAGSLVTGVQQAIAIDAVAERLGDAGVTPTQIRRVLETPAAEVELIDEAGDERRGAAFGVSLVLYILLLTVMVQVANAVAVEKSNRISEVLLAIVRPTALLFGKVIGVAVLGTMTLGAAIVPVIIRLGVGGSLPAGLGAALLGGAAWFLLGLALYTTMSGALGALVERQEEAGAIVSPLTAILVGTLILAQSATDSVVGTVLAYIPLTSPLMMPARIAMGLSSPVEIVGSLALGVVALALVVRFGGTIYARAIVRTGRRLKLREVLTSGR